ncbi:MAG: hypothetical protein QM757_26100 [Paludibaculum sp.]
MRNRGTFLAFLLLSTAGAYAQCQDAYLFRSHEYDKPISGRGAILPEDPCREMVMGRRRPVDEFRFLTTLPGRLEIRVRGRSGADPCVFVPGGLCGATAAVAVNPGIPASILVSTLGTGSSNYEIVAVLRRVECAVPGEPILLDMDSFSKFDLKGSCREPDGTRTEFFTFPVPAQQALTVEAWREPGPDPASPRLELRCGSRSTSGKESVSIEAGPGTCVLTVRGASTGAGPYTIRVHGPCAWRGLRPGSTVEEDVTLLDCRRREAIAGAEERGFGHGYRLAVAERSTCRVEASGHGAPMRLLLLDGPAVVAEGQSAGTGTARLTPTLRAGGHAIWVEATNHLLGTYRLSVECSPATDCQPTRIDPGGEVTGRFTGRECRVCDYTRGTDCNSLAHAYRVTVDQQALRIVLEATAANLIDWQGRPMSRTATAEDKGNYLFVVAGGTSGEEYKLRVEPVVR